MQGLENQMKTLLEAGLEEGFADLERLPNDRVCGHVVSSEFRGKSYEERRKLIKALLRQHLNPDEMLNISTLLTYTPEEWSYATEADTD